MLTERDAVQAREILARIRSGEIGANRAMRDSLRALSFTAARKLEPCEWFSECGEDMRREILAALTGFSACMEGADRRLILKPMPDIFDHHFWNDALPFWIQGSARYGGSSGEDVLIKLAARAYLEKI